ncbi:MAG: hypothetical protein DRN61_01990 [Thaumarchaeota archaeon]|nr:MAG: hypothetical protein DRN61_01990 [Nitrososphaerota archaeon]
MRLKVKAVVFDLDGTLYKSESYVRQLIDGIRDSLAEILSISSQEAEKLIQELRLRFGSITLGLKSLGIERSTFYDKLVGKLAPEKLIKPSSSMLEMLLEFKKMGLKIGCHTNASRKLAEKVFKALQIDPRIFDVLVTCDDADPKPTPSGYLKILKALKLKPGEVMYVGDRWRVELEPARRLGMKTVLISDQVEGSPDYVIKDILELRRIIHDP